MGRDLIDRIRLTPRLAAAIFIFGAAYLHQWRVMVQEQQLEGSGAGGLKFGGGYGLDRPYGGNNPTRGDVVALLEQVLPPGAPEPTEEDISFLLEQFRKLEPGTALSFDPALLGQRGGDDGTSNSLGQGRLQLDVAFGPPPLLLPPASFDDPQSCMGINDEALVLPPARGLQAAALAVPVGEARHDPPRCGSDASSCGEAAADARTKAADSRVHRAGREERMQRQRRMESDPPAAPPTKSDAFNHSSIRDALRRVKDQVKAVERLRSSIELGQDKSESRKRRRRQRQRHQ